MQYYFKYEGITIFNDLLYIEDHPYWNDATIWNHIPGYSRYLVNAYGEVIRARDAYLMRMHPDTRTVTLIRDSDRKKEKVCIHDIVAYDAHCASDTHCASANTTDILDDLIISLQVANPTEHTEPTDTTEPTEHTDTTEPTEPANPVANQINIQYLNNYPVILTDSDGEFMRWYPSIYNMLQRTHGTEGMDPHVIYRACSSPVWQKCYGKMFRWDPLLYVKYEMIATFHNKILH